MAMTHDEVTMLVEIARRSMKRNVDEISGLKFGRAGLSSAQCRKWHLPLKASKSSRRGKMAGMAIYIKSAAALMVIEFEPGMAGGFIALVNG